MSVQAGIKNFEKGLSFYNKENYSKAFEYFIKAQENGIECNDKLSILRKKLNIPEPIIPKQQKTKQAGIIIKHEKEIARRKQEKEIESARKKQQKESAKRKEERQNDALLSNAKNLLYDNDYYQALKVLNKITKTNPEIDNLKWQCSFEFGKQKKLNKQYNEAIELFDFARKIKGDAELYIELEDCLEKTGRYNRAMIICNEIIKIFSNEQIVNLYKNKYKNYEELQSRQITPSKSKTRKDNNNLFFSDNYNPYGDLYN